MAIQQLVKNEIYKLINKETLGTDNIELSVPKNTDHGDYSLNIAFKLAKVLKKAPIQIANDIEVDLKNTNLFSTTNLNGYINIKLNINELYKSFITFMDNKPSCNKDGSNITRICISKPNRTFTYWSWTLGSNRRFIISITKSNRIQC